MGGSVFHNSYPSYCIHPQRCISYSPYFLSFHRLYVIIKSYFPAPNGPFKVDSRHHGTRQLLERSHLRRVSASQTRGVHCYIPSSPRYEPPPLTTCPPKQLSSKTSNYPASVSRCNKLRAARAPTSRQGLMSYTRTWRASLSCVLFSPAPDTTRLFYSAIAQTIASSSYRCDHRRAIRRRRCRIPRRFFRFLPMLQLQTRLHINY